MTEPQRATGRQRLPRVAGIVGAVFLLGAGIWAMVGPRSFFDQVATFEPYNQHLIQDIGAFQIGLGAVLLLAVLALRLDALAVALLGVGVGAAAHVVSHVVGYDLGGTPQIDIPSLTLLAVVLLGAGVARVRGKGPR